MGTSPDEIATSNPVTVPVFSKDNLPSDPETWTRYPKVSLTPLFRVDGPFEVVTLEHDGVENEPFKCADGWLAVDPDGNPYAINAAEVGKIYDLDAGEDAPE